MAKPHKFAWNGIDVETTLTIEQLANMAQRAAQECTGDLMHGKHRIASTRSSDRQIEFRINDFLITFKKYLVFYLDFEVRGDRTWLSSRIDWYVTTQPTVGGFIPAGTKTMVAHRTYLQFVRHLAAQVRASDPQARITIREGVATAAAPGSVSSAPPPGPEPAAAPGIRPSAPASWQPPVDPPAGTPSTMPPVGIGPPPPAIAGLRIPPPPPPPAGPGGRSPVGARSPAVPPAPPPASTPEAGGLVTGVPGMPRREPPAERPREVVAAGYASIAEQLFAEDDSLFHTRMVQQTEAALPWAVQLPDGRVRAIDSALVLGRNPTAPPGSAAVPMAVDDPHRSVSKTHTLLELRDGLPWVTDLHSTNGTTLTNDVGEALICEPGVPVPVGDGWTAGLGEYSITVVRRGQGS